MNKIWIGYLNPKTRVWAQHEGRTKVVDSMGSTPSFYELGSYGQSINSVAVVKKEDYDLVCAHNTILQAEVAALKLKTSAVMTSAVMTEWARSHYEVEF